MPNHVTTRCIITGPADVLKAFAHQHITVDATDDDQKQCFNFKSIIPRPIAVEDVAARFDVEDGLVALGYDQTAGMKGEIGILMSAMKRSIYDRQCYKDSGVSTPEKLRAYLEERHPDALDNARKAVLAIEETGYRDWYCWSLDQWGTKWNSYSFGVISDEPGRYEFLFDTAWSFPEPIFRKLATLYPTLVFAVASIEEGMGWGARGEFNGQQEFRYIDADDELHADVFGEPPEECDDAQEDEQAAE